MNQYARQPSLKQTRWAYSPFRTPEPWYALDDERNDYPVTLGRFGAASPCQKVELTDQQRQDLLVRYSQADSRARAPETSENQA